MEAAKEKLNEVLETLDRYKERADKLKEQVNQLEAELKEINQDKEFDKYHEKNQEIEYYKEQAEKAEEEYTMQTTHRRKEIEASLLNPLIQGFNRAKKAANYDERKEQIIIEFEANMQALEKEYNYKLLGVYKDIYPQIERIQAHFGEERFRNYNLSAVTYMNTHYRRPLKEYKQDIKK